MSRTKECELDDRLKEDNLWLDVTVQLYSGRPNPSWSVFGREAVGFACALRDVLPVHEAVERQPKLGYQGLDVSVFDNLDVEEYAIFNGHIVSKGRWFFDRNRSIELALLKSGDSKIEKEIFEHIMSNISSHWIE